MPIRAGEFREEDPPTKTVDGVVKPIFAIRMKDTGIIYFDIDAIAHFEVVANLHLDFDQVADGGWIIDGKWCPGNSKRYSNKDPEEVKKINEECDTMRKYNE